MNLKRCTDAELLERTARDPEAFAVFYRRHERLVYSFLMSRRRDPELAADLAAEIFTTLLESSHRFDPERAGGSNAVPWILGVARNTLSASLRRGVVADDARRRMACDPLVVDDAELARVEELASADPTLSGLLDDLPNDLKDAVIARIVDERDYPDIAVELSCSELLIRKRVSRGLSRLRSALTHLDVSLTEQGASR
jgi:RNA polymerase sigma factor (sigma-70 family)